MAVLAIRCQQVRVPKRDSRVEDCEDACACAPERGLFAIADGATESAQSGLWAQLLVEEFIRHGHRAPWPAWVEPLQKRWAEQAQLPAGDQPWFVSEMNRHGAFATFLGLTADVARRDQGDWHALAVGDSCLFQVRDDQLEVVFPLEHSSQFTNTPWLVGSRTTLNGLAAHQQRQRSGIWLPGDRLWLMTDALSRWFLEEFEAGRRPWRELAGLLDQSGRAFADWVAGQRAERRLKDDDTSLVAVGF